MIAVDSNVLIYAHRKDSRWYETASTQIRKLAQGRSTWAVPWPCIHEFLAIVTHPGIYTPPTSLKEALDQVEEWLRSPSLVVLSENEGYWQEVRSLILEGRIVGPRVHDARIAALCLLHGVSELWTADRDFGRFPGLRVRNPLVG